MYIILRTVRKPQIIGKWAAFQQEEPHYSIREGKAIVVLPAFFLILYSPCFTLITYKPAPLIPHSKTLETLSILIDLITGFGNLVNKCEPPNTL